MTYRQHDKKTNMTETQNDKKTKMRKDKKTKTKKREYYCNVLKVFSNYRVGRHNFTPKKTIHYLQVWSPSYIFGHKVLPFVFITDLAKRGCHLH